MQRKSLWKLSAALALPVLAFTASSQAAILYTSAGFETFLPGDLNGQTVAPPTWTKVGTTANGSAVVTALEGTLLNGLKFNQNIPVTDTSNTLNQTTNTTAYILPVSYDSTTNPDKFVSVAFDLRVNTLANATNPGVNPPATNVITRALAGFEVFQGLTPLAAAYVGKTNAGTTEVVGYNALAETDTNSVAPTGTYAHYNLLLDFINHNYTVSVDNGGVPVVLGTTSFFGIVDAFDELDLAFYNGVNGSVSIDNLVVSTVPEPTSLSLLGLAGIGLMVRRRK